MLSKSTALRANRAEGLVESALRQGTRAEGPSSSADAGKVWAVPVKGGAERRTGGAIGVAYWCFEFVFAIIGLIVGAPFILIASILICCDSPGSPIYIHRRPGRSKIARGRNLIGRTDLRAPAEGFIDDALYYVPSYFYLFKLRTMYSDSRSRFPQLYEYRFAPESFRSSFPTLQEDPRVTRVGRLLRKLSVDELPNLWSVLTGELSLVGPRPEAPEVLQYYRPEEMYKFSCKPGITGLAQVNGRGLLNWGETIDCDLRYIRDWSVALDLKILFRTIVSVTTRHGAF